MPVARAFSMAISAARVITRWPMPLSPLRTAVEACSRTTRMSGRGLKPLALMRRGYLGRRGGAAAVPVGPLQSRFRHQGCDGHGVLVWQAEPLQRRMNE